VEKVFLMPQQLDPQRQPIRIARRRFLQGVVGTTATVVLSACGGATRVATPEPTRSASQADTLPVSPAVGTPVNLEGTTLSVLQWSSFLPVAGPKGSFSLGPTLSYGILKHSPNVEAARTFIRWSMSDSIWLPWFDVAGGFYNGVGPKQNDARLWERFPPAVWVLQDAPASSRGIGWPGPPDRKSALVASNLIVVDMFARAVQGESPEAAVAWAEREMQQIYT